MNPCLLLLATSGPAAQVGLASGSALSRLALGDGAQRGRGLLPRVAELLREAGLVPRDLTGLIVDVGPGSFTGVRVGVTAAKTLAFALGIPVVGVDSLDLLASLAPAGLPALSVRDAGRGTVYAALHAADGAGARRRERGPARVALAELLAWSTTAVWVGEEAPRLAHESGGRPPTCTAVAGVQALLALGAPRLAAEAHAGEAGAAPRPDGAALVPLYLQASAPERLLVEQALAAGGQAPEKAAGDRCPEGRS